MAGKKLGSIVERMPGLDTPVPEEEKRTKSFSFALTEREYADLKDFCEARQRRVGSFARWVLFAFIRGELVPPRKEG
jgi:hypothetical protein